jgi:hypothetical protein
MDEAVKLVANNGSVLFFHVLKNDGPRLMYCTYNDHRVLSIDESPIWLTEGSCPTCECLLGYGNAGDWRGLEDRINEPFKDLETSFHIISPLLGLLPEGFYFLRTVKRYPLYKIMNFFWSAKAISWNTEMCMAIDYRKFIIPTERPSRFNPERAEYYRDKPDVYGITLSNAYIGWCPTFLLDGHHKATAAALEGRMLNALEIDCDLNSLELYGMRISLTKEHLEYFREKKNYGKKGYSFFSKEILESGSKFNADNEVKKYG